MTTKIILINGVSSAGKTSIAKVLQETLNEPFLHVQLDTFEEMVPKRNFGGHQVFNRMLSGFHRSLAALAEAGNNLIVDHVILESEEPANWLSECLGLLSGYPVYFVGVRCSLDELNRREKTRGNRGTGLAEWQISRIHLHGTYDLEVDTTETSIEACATTIRQLVESDFVPWAAKAIGEGK